MKRNKKIILIAIVICFFLISILVGFMIFRDKIFISMPTSFICKQIEKEVPIGTEADMVIEFLKSKKGQSIFKNSEHEDYTINSGAQGNNIANYPAFYSFNNIEYINNLDYKNNDYGCYSTGAYLGTLPTENTSLWIGNEVYAIFVFDEQMKLMDIVVFRVFIGF